MQKNKTGPLFYTTYKNQLKMDRDLKIRSETIKFLEEKIRGKLLDIGLGNGLSKAKTNTWDYIKIMHSTT